MMKTGTTFMRASYAVSWDSHLMVINVSHIDILLLYTVTNPWWHFTIDVHNRRMHNLLCILLLCTSMVKCDIRIYYHAY